MFWFLVPNVLCLIIFIPFAKKIRRQYPEGITLTGYMAERYRSPKVKGVYSFQLGALAVLSTAVQLLAGGKTLALLTGLPFWSMTLALAAIAYSYSRFSGIKASVATDVVQLGIILLGGALLVALGLRLTGGLETVRTKLGGKVPVVIVRHDDQTEDIYGTVTHNRARGTHLLEPMKAIVKRLLDDGKSVQEIGKQLGMRPEEVFRLSEFSRDDFLAMMTKGVHGYSNAELLTKY